MVTFLKKETYEYGSWYSLKNLGGLYPAVTWYGIQLNPCPAEYIKMPRPLLIFSQSDYYIQIVAINLHT